MSDETVTERQVVKRETRLRREDIFNEEPRKWARRIPTGGNFGPMIECSSKRRLCLSVLTRLKKVFPLELKISGHVRPDT